MRINPIHLHILDPDYLDGIWAPASRPRNRCGWFMSVSGKDNPTTWATVQTVDHDLHRKRRAAFAPFFSKRNILALEGPIVKRKVNELCDRLAEHCREDKVINLTNAMSAFTMDVVAEYSFGKDGDNLQIPDFKNGLLDLFHMAAQIRSYSRQFPWLFEKLLVLPAWITRHINPFFAEQIRWEDCLRREIRNAFHDEKERRTVFHQIKKSSLPAEEMSVERLKDEANILLAAGTETTSRTIAVTCYYLIENFDVRAKLFEDFKSVMPSVHSDVSLAQLEQLPYLSAVVNEGLRMAHGVSERQPRIATQEDLVYQDNKAGKTWMIPRGTPIMQSAYLHHTNPDIFPDPFVFKPQRWIEDPKLSRYLMAFGRGSRSCVGMK